MTARQTQARHGWALWRWILLGALAAAGGVLCAVVADEPGRAALSFLGGYALSCTVFVLAVAQVRWIARYSPTASLLGALLTYTGTVVLFALVLAAADPDVLHPASFALGLVLGIGIWLVEQWQAARPKYDEGDD